MKTVNNRPFQYKITGKVSKSKWILANTNLNNLHFSFRIGKQTTTRLSVSMILRMTSKFGTSFEDLKYSKLV